MVGAAQRRFVELLLKNQGRIYRFILSLVPNWNDAEDLYQQTCMTLWERWEQFDPARDFTRWACGMAFNHVRNFVRKKQNRPLILSEGLLEELAERRLGHQPFLDEVHDALRACLDKLSTDRRNLVEACYGGHASIRAVADGTGRSSNAIYKLLRHIRAALYDCIARALAQGGIA